MVVYDKLTDQELTELLGGGDSAAFGEIYNRYSNLLYVYAFKLTADAATAQDIVQELFISLWDKRGQTVFSASLRAYLYSSVRYKFLKLVAHDRVRDGYAAQFLQGMEEGLNSTEDYMDEKELIAAVERLVLDLPPKMARAFIMSRLEFYSNTEIAAELNVSEKTVQNLLSMAVKRIRPNVGNGFLSLFLFC
ncbi:RNA polymerase sigma factor [Pedobacter faecalis]|uniref:RNA polymerase sigma factor n=1 Tax=Pedobacter faecalis TaxID=3041495 RepID=UPI0025511DD0|nr:RNA polymerase sigma-70 factor [Pedobacter sp. ELA7]